MGNYRFKLSDMMPNAWFYKLKDMSKGSKSQNQTIKRSHLPPKPNQFSSPPPSRTSYYFPSSSSPIHPKANDTHFPLDPPRKSKHKLRRKPVNLSPKLISSNCSSSIPNSPTDIIIDVSSELELPPILTKPAKKEEEEEEFSKVDYKKAPARKPNQGIHRLRMRANSPRLANKRAPVRKGMKESFAVVKSSSDPKKDFKVSMMEMIVENDLRGSKDLEELLACYLSLNCTEYHDVIVKVFEEIWYDITETTGL